MSQSTTLPALLEACPPVSSSRASPHPQGRRSGTPYLPADPADLLPPREAPRAQRRSPLAWTRPHRDRPSDLGLPRGVLGAPRVDALCGSPYISSLSRTLLRGCEALVFS